MNWLLIIVLIILAAFVFEGYYKGFIRVFFSLISFMLILTLTTIATPHAVNFIEEETTLADQVTEKCLAHIEANGQENLEHETQMKQEEAEEQAKKFGIELPSDWMDRAMESGSEELGEALKASGVYQAMAEKMSRFIVTGATFFTLFILIALVLNLLIRALDIVARLPGLKGANHLLGMLIGFVKGLVVIWLLMYLVSIFAAGSFGLLMMDYMERSRFLSFLYEYNPVLWMIENIF